MTTEQMRQRLPELTPKIELVILAEGTYKRDVAEGGEKGFRRLGDEPHGDRD
jgi:hypothetical protein